MGYKKIIVIAIAFAAISILFFTYIGKRSIIKRREGALLPVVFIHGHKCHAGYFDKFKKELLKRGYPENYLLAIQLVPNDGSNIEAAERQIAPAINELLTTIKKKRIPAKQKEIEKVNIISHSMGALSARWYAAKVRPDRVNVWISLAGANHGTNIACGANDPGSNDMCPAFAEGLEESRIQFLLNGRPKLPDIDETPFGIGTDSVGVSSLRPDKDRRILYITIRIETDRIITPKESAELDGSGGLLFNLPDRLKLRQNTAGNFILYENISHDGIVESEKVIEIAEHIINLKF
jgi:pimeloyl-ACP methyl ester carboxylesterase